MLERLIVTETIPHRLLELGYGREEAIVGGAAPEYLPEPLDHLQLGTVAGQWIEFQMRAGRQDCSDSGSAVPGRFVDHDHHPGLLRSGIGSSDVPQVAGKRFLYIALF